MSLKIAIVGTGSVARNSYLPRLVEHEDVELTYFNRTPEKAVQCAETFGGTVLRSLHDVVAGDPDAVMVLTLENDRADVLDALLDLKPKRIFCEKPLVAADGQAHVSEEDFFRARDLTAKAATGGTELAMVFNYRFFDNVVKARDMAERRGFGDVTQITALVHYACWSHCIDLINCFGGPADEITAMTGKRTHGAGAFSANDVAGAFCLENGATGTIMGTSGTDFASPLFELTIALQKGRIRLVGLDVEATVIDYTTHHAELFTLRNSENRTDPYARSFGKSVAAYLDSVRAGAPPPVPGLAGLQELQFEAALRRSAAEARTIKVQKEFALLP